MRVLFVGSLNNHNGHFAPFIVEQADALRSVGCDVEYFGVTGKGLLGYLKQIPYLRRKIYADKIDIIHAHYGLCCLLANMQRKVPVVSTYHGSDINVKSVLKLSKIAMALSAWNIFVSERTHDIALSSVKTAIKKKCSLIPCGINLPKVSALCPDMSAVLEPNKKHVLFAGAFYNDVKDPELAKSIVGLLTNVQLIELKGYSRDEVNGLMYQCDALLMTSKTEGSPQVIKEAMACGLPIVSTDVGDVKERVAGLSGCYVAQNRNPKELVGLLSNALSLKGRTNGRDLIIKSELTNESVAKKIIKIYKSVLQ